MMKKMDNKYIPLADFFQNATQSEIVLTYEAIENIMGQQLPNAAYLNQSWWKKNSLPRSHYLSWVEADYCVFAINLGHTVTFKKKSQNTSITANSNMPTIIIRSIDNEDARPFIDLQTRIYQQADFEYFDGFEFKTTVQQVKKRLAEWKTTMNSTTLLCIADGAYAGYVTINGYTTPKQAHVGIVRIGIDQPYRNKGLATALLKRAITWAQSNNLERLEVQIIDKNTAAIRLFEKFAFSNDGIRKQAIKTNDLYLDELYYSKLLK